MDSLQSKVTNSSIKQDKQAINEETLGLRFNSHVRAVNSNFDSQAKESFRYSSIKESFERTRAMTELLLELQVIARYKNNESDTHLNNII